VRSLNTPTGRWKHSSPFDYDDDDDDDHDDDDDDDDDNDDDNDDDDDDDCDDYDDVVVVVLLLMTMMMTTTMMMMMVMMMMTRQITCEQGCQTIASKALDAFVMFVYLPKSINCQEHSSEDYCYTAACTK